MNSPLWSKEDMEELRRAIEAADKETRRCQTPQFWAAVAIAATVLFAVLVAVFVW